MDVNSGSIHVVDDVAYDLIALYRDRSEEDILSQLLDKYGSRPM